MGLPCSIPQDSAAYLTGACQVEYDCRIVFAFEKEPDNEKDLIVLVDIGKHDEVY